MEKIDILVIDDGSTDGTSDIAKKLGVTYIVRHKQNRGLAKSFADGLDRALRMGATIIVNTDADNQYPQADIPRLIAPIINGDADIVIGNRQTQTIAHFSKLKKFFQWLGSATIRYMTNSSVPDAVSGFRAYSRGAAIELNIVTDFSYAIETIISAQSKRLNIQSIDISTNPPTRKSRLFKNMFEHMRHSGATLIRVYTMFRPLVVFTIIGGTISTVGILVGIRFVYYLLLGQGSGHVQSLIFSAILIMVGFQILTTGMVADLIAINRKLQENSLTKLKKMELELLKNNI